MRVEVKACQQKSVVWKRYMTTNYFNQSRNNVAYIDFS